MANMHRQSLNEMVEKALQEVSPGPLDGLAITTGPGLPPCLGVGLEIASEWARKLSVELMSVNHLEAHLLMPLMFAPQVKYPYLVFLVSGGHCMVVLARGLGQYEVIGSTEDDSVGEAFDKTARLLGECMDGDIYETARTIMKETQVGDCNFEHLSGGSLIETLARRGDPDAINLAVPLRKAERRYDIAFSFSGIKTDVLKRVRAAQNRNLSTHEVHKSLPILRNSNKATLVPKDGKFTNEKLSTEMVCNMAASFQQTAFTHLLEKLQLALWRYKSETTTLIVSGGVSANSYFRERLKKMTDEAEFDLLVAPIRYCTDNAVMIGFTALQRLHNKCHQPVELPIKEQSRWPITTLDSYYRYD